MFGCYYNDRIPMASVQRGRLERTTSDSSTFSREGCYKQSCNTSSSSHGNMNVDASGNHGIHHLAHAAVQERHPQTPPPSAYIVHGQFDDAPEPEDISMEEATHETPLRRFERTAADRDREQKWQHRQPYSSHSFRDGVGAIAPEYQEVPPPPTSAPHHRYQEPLFQHQEPHRLHQHYHQETRASPPFPTRTAKTSPTHQAAPQAPVVPPATTTMTAESHRVFVERPGENDVLCGRGKGVNDHVGNRRFRLIVGQFRESYLSSSRCDKAGISRQVVEIVGGQHPPGRFLKRASTDEVQARGQAQQGVLWYEVDRYVALEKTSQALREGSPRHTLTKKKRLSSCSAPAAPVEATGETSRVFHHHEHRRPSCVVSP